MKPSVPMIDMRSSMSNGVFSGMHHTVSSVAVAPPAKRYIVWPMSGCLRPRTSTVCA